MSETHSTLPEFDQPRRYEIRVKGLLDHRWTDGFEGLNFTHESDGTTLLAGLITDQAALHGVLNRIRDLGLPIVSVQCLGPELKLPLANRTNVR